MKINFPVEETIRMRRSIRNYNNNAIPEKTQNDIRLFLETLDNPFNQKVNFHSLNIKEIKSTQKLGTYGVIKGAHQFIGTSINNSKESLYALGYEFEALVLYLSHIGIGTCWLGGTFNRQQFSQAMNIDADELFPIISPIGYPADHPHFKEKAMRKLIKADARKEFSALFFLNDFQTPLTQETAGELCFALEMVRLGPSASNKQPWRILLKNNTCHFFEEREPGYSKAFPYDIQKVDLGIAAAHFDFSLQEAKLDGHFETKADPSVEIPKNFEYAFSWIRD
ncbi:nitroreductase family protein [Eubacteriaceae bacterium ES3]|nr:nitroreductase family protein [Eubacteriaceae bacterium ES3]